MVVAMVVVMVMAVLAVVEEIVMVVVVMVVRVATCNVRKAGKCTLAMFPRQGEDRLVTS